MFCVQYCSRDETILLRSGEMSFVNIILPAMNHKTLINYIIKGPCIELFQGAILPIVEIKLLTEGRKVFFFFL
jgi:hypothetical protein